MTRNLISMKEYKSRAQFVSTDDLMSCALDIFSKEEQREEKMIITVRDAISDQKKYANLEKELGIRR